MISRKKYLEQCCDNYAQMNKELMLKCKRFEEENQILRQFVNKYGYTAEKNADLILKDIEGGMDVRSALVKHLNLKSALKNVMEEEMV